MCGIAGIIGRQPSNQQTVKRMLEKQTHRGPDAQAIWHESPCTLGHNRLSIIDLSSGANQPMLSTSGRFIVVFNGEIYNYTELKGQLKEYSFKTNSDTEVLLALFEQKGSAMLNDLNGMFSIAIWDKQENKLFAARDRFGVKPFYYAIKNGQFYFASEIKTLWEAGIEKVENKKVWANYLSFGTYGMPNETFWGNVQQLPGGHYFEYEFSQPEIVPIKWYHFVENIKSTPALTEAEVKIKYSALLQDSIQLRFRADVPVGFNISGGLDSSVLLALVKREFPENEKIEAYTFYCNDKKYDELPWVEKLINKTKYKLNKCLLPIHEVSDLIEKIGYFQDEPFGGFPTLAYSKIFEAARKKGVLVLLDGQGMDEAWAGYDYYQTNTGFTIQGATSSPVKPIGITEEFKKYAEKEIYDAPFDNDLQNLQYRDLFYTKIPRALRFNDRISMMHSTELREPFLDYRLVELAFAQSATLKIKNGQSKWMLRQMVSELLGNNIAFAPKRPLQTPQREWIQNELKDFFDTEIEQFVELDICNKNELNTLWTSYKKQGSDNSFYIWQWVNLNRLSK